MKKTERTEDSKPITEIPIMANSLKIGARIAESELRLVLLDSQLPDMPTILRIYHPSQVAAVIEELIAYRHFLWPDADEPNFNARLDVEDTHDNS